MGLGSGFRVQARWSAGWTDAEELSYYIGETLLFTIYTHYGNLI